MSLAKQWREARRQIRRAASDAERRMAEVRLAKIECKIDPRQLEKLRKDTP